MIVAGASIGKLQSGMPLDALENRILLCHALGLTRVGLITQSARALTEDEAARLSSLVARRLKGEPIAYIVGKREFFGLDFAVTDAVLIPRPDTELLVDGIYRTELARPVVRGGGPSAYYELGERFDLVRPD